MLTFHLKYSLLLLLEKQDNIKEPISTDDSNLNLVDDSSNEESSKNSDYKKEAIEYRESQERYDQEDKTDDIIPNILISSLEVIDEEEIQQTR